MLLKVANLANPYQRNETCYMPSSSINLRPASEFTTEELAEIYNQARTDYIVPMPMNAARLQQYIDNYNVRLEYSAVALENEQCLGLSMLGVRPEHTWVTRLGILPMQRRRGTGEKLMRYHIDRSRELGVKYITLDVIKNNIPAQNLFAKLGFKEQRELLILRRPPGPPKREVAPYKVRLMGENEAVKLLQRRKSIPSWLDENSSLINAGNLFAMEIDSLNGNRGWIVYQKTIFQLGRIVIQTEEGNPREVARTLAHALHSHNPLQDTKTENFPLLDPHLPGLQEMGYIESFRRIELRLTFEHN